MLLLLRSKEREWELEPLWNEHKSVNGPEPIIGATVAGVRFRSLNYATGVE